MPPSSTPGQAPSGSDQPREPAAPGPAPSGPAVHDLPLQKPVDPPEDPGPAPVGPAVHPERTQGAS